MKEANELIDESSPYLLQHAYNPVKWVAWSEDVFERARKENKLVLISVGYSACHWCHVMEHESFEDEDVAALMNRYFINVKVDREERPDVDQVYMTAVQIMTQRGGWPLNCFTLPDGRPIYGGTYFPKEQWKNILQSLQHLFVNDPQKAEEYAAQLHEGIVNSELIARPESVDSLKSDKLHELVFRWKKQFDSMEGGSTRAPKFPLPSNYQFLLRYGIKYQDESVLKHVELTLDKMANGGIYDQVGGGFTRYSVDMLWKVPHFEKMLYDNGQLISLYSQAYKVFKKPIYKRVVEQTINWLEREMLHSEGAYYAALDADSEGEEGKFYCWSIEEYKKILGDYFSFAADLYTINSRSYWEEDKYIPLRIFSDEQLMQRHDLSMEDLEKKINTVNDLLLSHRNGRVRPGIDDKLLTSWNAMLVKGFCDAYAALGHKEYLHFANKIVRWICRYQLDESGKLWRTRKNGISKIDGFLEDYAHVAEAFISYYEVSGEEHYALEAKKIVEYTIENFQHVDSKMFYFADSNSQLIARKMDINDNVIPSSNSTMAHVLFKAGLLFEKQDWIDVSKQQLKNVYDGMEMYGSGYSNWSLLLMNFLSEYYEVVVSGEKQADDEILGLYMPDVLIAYESEVIPLGKYKRSESKSYFVCSQENGCQAPVHTLEELLHLIN